MVSFPPVSPPRPYTHTPLLTHTRHMPCTTHSWFETRPIWVRSTNHLAPCYAISSTDCFVSRRSLLHVSVKATNTNSDYVILIAFPLQQWLYEQASMLLYTYINHVLFPPVTMDEFPHCLNIARHTSLTDFMKSHFAHLVRIYFFHLSRAAQNLWYIWPLTQYR